MVTYKNKTASPLHFSQGAGCFLILLQCYNLLHKHFKEQLLNLLVKFFLIARRKAWKTQRNGFPLILFFHRCWHMQVFSPERFRL